MYLAPQVFSNSSFSYRMPSRTSFSRQTLRSQRVLGYGRIPLPDVAGLGKNCPDQMHLLVGQAMDPLKLLEEDLVLLFERLGARRAGEEKDRTQKRQDADAETRVFFHGSPFPTR